jgi:hypothetical protein
MKHLTTETPTPASQHRARRGPRTRRHGEERAIRSSGRRDIENASSGQGGRGPQEATSASRTIYALIRSTVDILKATLCEIFDESAYDRFLIRTHSDRSVSSYRAFIRERENAMAQKQRCC